MPVVFKKRFQSGIGVPRSQGWRFARLEQTTGVAQTVGGDDGLVAGGDHEVEIIEPLHGAQGGEAHAAATVAVVGNLPAVIRMAVAVVGAVKPGTEFVFAPDLGVVARNDLRKAPDTTDDFEVVTFGGVTGEEFGHGEKGGSTDRHVRLTEILIYTAETGTPQRFS